MSDFNFNKTIKKIYCALYEKYQTTKKIINTYIIDNLIFNEKTHVVSVFKDYLIYDDNYDFFRKFYKIDESNRKLKKYLHYYEKYNITLPNYSSLPESNYIYHNIRMKQVLINKIQSHKNKEKLKKEHKNDNSQFLDSENYEQVFNSHIYNSIFKKSEKCLSIFGIDNDNQNGKNQKSITLSQIGDIINNINEIDLKIAEKKNNNKKIYSKKKKLISSKKTNSKDSFSYNIINNTNNVINTTTSNCKKKRINKVPGIKQRYNNFKYNIRLNYLYKLDKLSDTKNSEALKQNYSITNPDNKKKIFLTSTSNNNNSNNNSTILSNTNQTFIKIKKFNFNSFLDNKSNNKTFHPSSLHKPHLKSKILSNDIQKIKVNITSNNKIQNKYSKLLNSKNFLCKTINENEKLMGIYFPKKNYKLLTNMKKQILLPNSPNYNSLANSKNKNRVGRVSSSKKNSKKKNDKYPRLRHFNTNLINKNTKTNIMNSFFLPKKDYLLNGNKLVLKNKSINTDLMPNINDSNYRLATLNNSRKRINTDINKLINYPFSKNSTNSKKILLDDNAHILNSNKFSSIDPINNSNKKQFFKNYLQKRNINTAKNSHHNIKYLTSSYLRNTVSHQSINLGNVSMKNNNKFHVKTRNGYIFSGNINGNNLHKISSRKLNYTTISHKLNKIKKIDYKNENKKEKLKTIKNYQDKQTNKIIEKENLIKEKIKKNIKSLYNKLDYKGLKNNSRLNDDRIGKK